jgi:microcystin-dependent protein
MSEPYLGEIRMFAGNFPPRGWAFCDGQLLSIAQNDALFMLLGTTYGGDGVTTFALPDMRGRFPVNPVSGGEGVTSRFLGEQFGEEAVTLTGANLPPHTHSLMTSKNGADSTDPTGKVLGTRDGVYLEVAADADNAFGGAVGGNSGASSPHNNLSPYLGVSFIIALNGVFPFQGG